MIRGANYSGLFNDKRLETRGVNLLGSLMRLGSQSIQAISESRAEQKGYYRLLRNKKVDESSIIKEITGRCGLNCRDKVVLAIQDTTEINLSSHRNRIKYDESLGRINDNFDGIGFKLHPSLVVDAHTCYPYGYGAVDMWSREHVRKEKTSYRHRILDVSEKETNVWVASRNSMRDNLKEAHTVISVQDREGDFYEQFAADANDGKFFLLIRSNHNRKLTEGIKLWDHIAQQPVSGTYQVIICPQHKGKRGKPRAATIAVKIAQVSLKKPQKKNKEIPESSVALTVIEAREITPGCEEPVLWRLYTTWPVETFEDACQVIEWYSWRWMIEEVFKVLKKECFNIEASELESGWAIRKLTLMLLDTIVKLFQMSIAYNMPEGEAPDTQSMFCSDEIACLDKVNQKVQGKTQKLSNPCDKTKLSWAFWILARLGGWKGYASQTKPGFATLINGLKKFYAIHQGFSIEKDVGTQ